MTKKLITLLIAGIMAISILSGCNGTVTSTETQTKPGAYELYYTTSTEDYLNFLNELDEEKYEIKDTDNDGGTWYVTYKIKE